MMIPQLARPEDFDDELTVVYPGHDAEEPTVSYPQLLVASVTQSQIELRALGYTEETIEIASMFALNHGTNEVARRPRRRERP